MKYYLFVRDGEEDHRPLLDGPYNSIQAAKNRACDFAMPPGRQFIVLGISKNGETKAREVGNIPTNMIKWEVL